jgi:hypothetical protein
MERLTPAERMAALLDGRLTAEEQAALLAEIGASDDDLETLVDAAAVTRELEDEDRAEELRPPAVAGVPADAETETEGVVPITAAPSRRKARPFWADRRVLAAAAVMVLAVGSGLWLARDRPAATPADALPAGMRLPPGWKHSFSIRRGSGDDALARRTTAFRFGALETDLQIAAQSNDAAAARKTAGEIRELLIQPGGAALMADDYERMAASPTGPSVARVREVATQTRLALDARLAAFGAWVEGARLAAAARNEAFFHDRLGRDYLAGHAPAGVGDGAADALGRVRGALHEGDTPDWAALRQALDDLMAEVG